MIASCERLWRHVTKSVVTARCQPVSTGEATSQTFEPSDNIASFNSTKMEAIKKDQITQNKTPYVGNSRNINAKRTLYRLLTKFTKSVYPNRSYLAN